MFQTRPFDPSWHAPSSAARRGHCSWHGPVSCGGAPVVSFLDDFGYRQSGCARALEELRGRGLVDEQRDPDFGGVG